MMYSDPYRLYRRRFREYLWPHRCVSVAVKRRVAGIVMVMTVEDHVRVVVVELPPEGPHVALVDVVRADGEDRPVPHGERAGSGVGTQVLVKPGDYGSLIASVVAGSALAVKHDYVPASRIVAVIAVTAAAATWLERGRPIAEEAIVTGCAALVIIVVAGRRPGAVNVRLRLT